MELIRGGCGESGFGDTGVAEEVAEISAIPNKLPAPDLASISVLLSLFTEKAVLVLLVITPEAFELPFKV